VRVVIIGAGIGGLAAALAVYRRDITLTVYEQSDALREQGAGLWLWANALHALRRLGVEADVRRLGIAGNPGQIRSSDGTPIVGLVAAEERDLPASAATIAVHRADLLRALYAALPPDVVHFGARFVASTVTQDGVTAHFADGRAVHGDVLVGADGIRSLLRAQLWNDGPPRYAGFSAWRAVVPFPHARVAPGMSWGRGSRFGTMPVREGQVNWFAARNAPAGGQDDVATLSATLLAAFGAWHAPTAELITTTDPASVLRNDIFDRPPLGRWSEGRRTLLGDAAHPMTPSLGQGACQALEDAVVLADCLATIPAVPQALHTYDTQRIPRTRAVQQQAQLLDRLIQLEHPLLCYARDLLFRSMPPALRARRLRAILDVRV
jgi:2-polyprenyl-6-methoxyphenol hydroxylase-like FAD-dependent oxidoreductase